MGRTRLARARIEELKNRIVFCERNRRKLIDYLQDLKDKWLAKEIIYSEYEEIAGEKLEGRTRKEWINYYYNYIEDCEKRIRKEREKLVRNKIILVSFFAVFILIVGVFYVNPVIIGLIVQEQKQEFIQELNLEFTQSESYEWRLENIGELTSVRISGSIEKDGKVKVYLGDLLILDSNDNKIKKIITGQIVAVEEGKGILNFFKNILGVLGIIGRVVEELDEGAVEEPEESSSEESEGAPPEDSSPSQEEPSPSETEEEEPKEEIIEETLEEEQKVEGEQQIDGEEPVEVEEESKELIIEEEIIEESPEELKEKEKPKPKKEVIIREFTYICDETCDLSGLNLDKDSYTLRIEITGKTKLNLDKIKYEIIPFPVPEEEIEEEIPEEVPEEVPEEEKPKEEIIPEINVTELPTPEENITEIPENVTLIPQINITNITQAPVLIKNIPEIEIQKNTYGIIDVTEYFSDAEQFFILQVKNLTTTTYDHRIKIVPDKEFLGNRTVKIIASNSFGMAESNFFNIIVVEFLAGPRLLKDIPDIYILKNNFTEIDITQYFAGAEQYYLLQTINISTTTYDHTIKIQPDANFIGTRTSKIIAVNEFGETESNFFDIIVSEEIPEVIPEEIPINITVPGEVNISTLQYKAVINRPQKWIKVIEAGSVEDIANLTIELPKQAENITVKTGLEVDEALLELEEYEDLIEQANKEDLVSGSITGNVAFDVTQGRGIITRLGKWLRGFTTRRPLSYSCRSLDDQECKSRGILGITGNVISEEDLQEEITETLDSKIIDIGKIANETQENLIAVEYYTAGPIATEETTKRGKRVIVSAADELNYTDILAFTELTEEVAAKQIRLYRTTDGIREQTEFASYDLNNNGLIEYIEWIVPHLSNQTYELEIVIIDAEHLDENRDFVANIFEYVNTTDGITYTIPENQYARAYFERNLTNQNIIDVFVINTQPATIEVYEKDSDVVIGKIEEITTGRYYIDLNHSGSQYVFDLKSIGNEVIYDYIHDQQEAEFYEDWEAGNFNNWDNNNWVIDSAVAIETNSAKCETTSSTGLNCYVNTTASIDTSGSTSVNVSFQFNDDDTDGTGGGDVEWYWNDSDGVWDSFGLIDAGTLGFSDDVWNNYSRLSTDPQYQHIGFAVRFRAELEKNENYWIDNINVTSTPDETAPEVNITLPKNATYSDSHMPLNFNVSLNEQGSVQYSLDGGKNNITMFDGANRVGFVFNFTNTSIPDGSYTFQVYANDTYNNKNHTENVTFSIDKTIPDVNFTDPTPADGSSQTNTDIFVNISSSDTSDHYTFVDFDKDVFLWMTMEQSDGSVTDFSSYSNDGTFIGDAFQNTSGGRFGFGAQFDGVDEDPPDAINVSSLASSLRFNESFTVSVWIKTGTIVRADILGTRNTLTTGSGWKIGINQQDKPLFTANDTLDLEIVTSPEAIIAGEWVHIVGVYNKSTPSLQIYVNGTLKDTQTAGASTIGYANDQDFRIGMTDTNGRIWSGSIDEVMLFNRSLDAGEISALYNASATQYVHNFTGLSTITHNFTGYAVDIYGNKNQTEERNVTISAAGADSTPPDVNITFPENLTYGSNDLPLNFNVTLNENGSVQYTLDGGENNVTMFNGTNIIGRYFNATNDSIADGSYTFIAYANDTAGNNNYTENVTFSFLNNGRTACGTLDTAGTTYILLRNITTTGTCFQVTANDITLDGNGFSVSGDNAAGHFGVNATGRTDFTIQNINITDFTISVSTAGFGTNGQSGGNLTILNSSLEVVDASGEDTSVGNAGFAGNINIFESNITENITASGGSSSDSDGGDGGDGGNVIFENTNINLTSAIVNITGGVGATSDGVAGTLTLNYSGFFEDFNADYGDRLSLIIINDSSAGGIIKWLPELVSTGITNLSINTEIRNNSAFANSTALSALNVTANITFYGMPGTFTDPVILINGTSICDTTTSPACSNFTSLNAATVIFNVSFWDVLNYTIGERPDGNNAPQITHVYNDTTQLASGVTLNEGPSSTTLVINFSVNDAEGIGDLDNSTATLNITRSGEPVRFNNTCSQISSQASGNNANYSCEVIVYWFDLDGEWLINASIKDSAGEFANNNTEVFNINSLTAFVSGPGNLTFGGINTGDINVTSTNDPLLINNTGNQDFADGSIEINATDLIGEENPAFALWSGNFSVGNVSDGSNAECNFGGSGGDSAPNATRMNFTHAGGNFVTIKLANLSRGNFSVNDGQTGQEELFICLLQVGSEISAQPYSTASQGAWTIRILWIGPLLKILFLEGIGSGILLAAVITRKKKRKSIRDDKLDKAVKALTLLIDELRDKYGLSKKETLDLVIKELAEKYKIGKKELIEVLELRIKENIPSTIFSKKLGGLEAIVKYMKENLGMSYSEIAKQLVRDDRTIWTSYKKATEKQPEALEVKETSTFFPIEIFKDRNLTVLESIVVYLKEKGLRYSEIAKLLDRDQRNIQTIYSRAIKKLHKGE